MNDKTTTPDEAMKLIRELDEASMKAQGQSKTTFKRLERAATKLFVALTGTKPTPEQVKQMVSW